MLARHASALALLLGAGLASAQTGPQLLTTFPPGAAPGAVVEVTFAGSGFTGDEKLLFSNPAIKGELVGGAPAIDPKAKQPAMAAPATAVKFKVSVPRDTAPGAYDVRVVSKAGLTNPRTFVVGDGTDVNEAEPNNDVGQAQKIDLNTTVNGVISAPTDVDFVTFRAKGGQNVVVHCLTSSIDSRLSADIMVSSSDGKPLVANRGYRGGDAVLDFKAPADGDYLVRLAQFAYTTGGTDHFYRLTVTDGPWVDAVFPPLRADPSFKYTVFGRNLKQATPDARFLRPDGRPFDTLSGATVDTPLPKGSRGALATGQPVSPPAGAIDAAEVNLPAVHALSRPVLLSAAGPVVLDNDKNGTGDAAQVVTVPCDIAGRIGKKNDRHWYAFDAKKGDVWTLEVFADRIGSQMDAFFVLADEKGKAIAEIDDGPDTLNPNQFYTKSDDPARYRFVVPADGKYRVMVSSREAGIQYGVRDQYVLRIARENPDFRLAVMPVTPHLPEGGTLVRNGATMFNVFVFRFDGFNDPITLTAAGLPPGVACPPQVIGAGQTRGVLVFTAEKDAKDWDGYVQIAAAAGDLKYAARPFTVTWPVQGAQANQPPPNSPMLTRLDRGPGLALAVRGDAPFSLTPTEKQLKVKAGDKVEITLKVSRDAAFKDGIQVFSGLTPPPGGKQPTPIATIAADKTEAKISVDVPSNLPPGEHTLVLRGQSSAPPPKGPNNTVRPFPIYPATPITLVIDGAPKKK